MLDMLSVGAEEAEALHDAARDWLACQRDLALRGQTVLDEILGAAGLGQSWAHYPPGDVYDPVSHGQYYFHAHPPGTRPLGELGHFHTFLRPFGVTSGLQPAPLAGFVMPANKLDLISHLVAVAVDGLGRPVRLFVTNRWVTGETWYAAAAVQHCARQFRIDNARPARLADQWLTALLRLFRAEIDVLIEARDQVLQHAVPSQAGLLIYEDRAYEELASCDIDIEGRLAAILAA